MYTLVAAKKPAKEYDYIFKEYKMFYEVCDLISYAIGRRYTVCIQTDNIKDTQEFIKKADRYEPLIIEILMPESAVNYIAMYNPNIRVKEAVSLYEVFRRLISKYEVLISNQLMSVLYSSVSHEVDGMEDAVRSIVAEYGSHVCITEKMLEKLFVLNRDVYPRSVFIAFVYQERYRYSKLEKSIRCFGNDVVLGAMVKNLKKAIEEKVAYFKTGQASKLLRSLNTRNLLLMYRVLVTERNGLDDVTILLDLYERGLSAYDLIREEED